MAPPVAQAPFATGAATGVPSDDDAEVGTRPPPRVPEAALGGVPRVSRDPDAGSTDAGTAAPFAMGAAFGSAAFGAAAGSAAPFAMGAAFGFASRIRKGGAAFSLAFQPPLADRDSCRELWHVGAEVGPVGTVGVVDADDRSNMCVSCRESPAPESPRGGEQTRTAFLPRQYSSLGRRKNAVFSSSLLPGLLSGQTCTGAAPSRRAHPGSNNAP